MHRALQGHWELDELEDEHNFEHSKLLNVAEVVEVLSYQFFARVVDVHHRAFTQLGS